MSSAYDGFGWNYTMTADSQDVYDPVAFGGQHGYYRDYTGQYLLTHRYYDAGAGRFLTRDPIGYGAGINLYGFAGNNPVNDSDPSGFDPGNLGEWYSAWNNTSLSDIWEVTKHNITRNFNLRLAGGAFKEAGEIIATYNPFGFGEEVLAGRVIGVAGPWAVRGADAARNARLAKQLMKGSDVEVNSIKDADQVLKIAFPNAKKFKGTGPGQQRAGVTLYRGKNPNGMYRKDYLVNPETGRLYGHDNYNTHGDFKHINVRLPSGDDVLIKIKP